MPLPKTKDVGRLIRFLKKEKPTMKPKQRIAIAIEKARESGAHIKKKKRKKRSKHA